MEKGQGSDYPFMLATALCIALVAAALLGFFPAIIPQERLHASAAYWQPALPIGVAGASAKETGVLTLAIANNAAEPISISSVILGGAEYPISQIYLSGGARSQIRVRPFLSSTDGICERSLSFRYQTSNFGNLVQTGSKKIAIACPSAIPQLPACLIDGEGCSADSDCCSGICADSCSEPGLQPEGQLSAEELNLRLMPLLEKYAAASPQERRGLEGRAASLAQERAPLMLEIMEKDPQYALRLSLPSALVFALPEYISSKIGAEQEMRGELSAYYEDDFARKLHFERDFLLQEGGGRIQLHFAGPPPALPTGSQIRVRGLLLENRMAIPTHPTSLEILSEALPGHTVKRTAVIMLNFLDDSSQPFGAQQLRELLFSGEKSLRSYYLESSFGQVEYAGKGGPTGEIFGPYPIPYKSSPCRWEEWADSADSAAMKSGASFRGYDNYIYVFPSAASCKGRAYGQQNGGRSWAGGLQGLYFYAHELGHNLGAYHADGLNCYYQGKRAAIGDNCTVLPYADQFDIMGYSPEIRHTNSHNKGYLNWFSESQVLIANSSGNYTLWPQESPSIGPASIRIPRAYDSQGRVRQYLQLEYRRPYGFDDFGEASPAVNGILLRIAPALSGPTYLLDATPATPNFLDAALAPGRAFADWPASGAVVRVLRTGERNATVEITFGARGCARANPSLFISPASQWAKANGELTYVLTIRNNDANCPATEFGIDAKSNLGWPAAAPPKSAPLLPGEEADVEIALSVPPSALPGHYESLGISVSNGLAGSSIRSSKISAYANIYES